MEVSNVDIGQNVQRARYLRGLTQIDVAAAIGVDRTAVSRIEAGTRSVAATELLALAELLAVPIAELLKPSPGPTRSRELGRMLMRTGPATANDELQLGWFVELMELAQIAGPPSALPRLPVRLLALPSEPAGELGARWVRRTLGLDVAGPVSSVSGLLYRSGVMVATARLPSASRLAGGALAMPSGLCGILVNANHPQRRQRFTALHELAHLLFDFGPQGAGTTCDAGEVRPGPRSSAEARSDAFAGAFLVPRRAVTGLVSAAPDLALLREFETEYGVSHAAAVRRLRELRLVTDVRSRALRKQAGGARPTGGPAPPFRCAGESFAKLVSFEGSRGSGAEHSYEVRPDAEVLA